MYAAASPPLLATPREVTRGRAIAVGGHAAAAMATVSAPAETRRERLMMWGRWGKTRAASSVGWSREGSTRPSRGGTGSARWWRGLHGGVKSEGALLYSFAGGDTLVPPDGWPLAGNRAATSLGCYPGCPPVRAAALVVHSVGWTAPHPIRHGGGTHPTLWSGAHRWRRARSVSPPPKPAGGRERTLA